MQIYILEGQEQKGPFTAEELRQQIQRGECSPESAAWHEGLATWLQLADLLRGHGESAQDQVASDLQPVANPQPQTPTAKRDGLPWHERSAVVFPALFLCFPFGLLPLWISKRFGLGIKVGLSIAVAVLYAFVAIAGVVGLAVAGAAHHETQAREQAAAEERLSNDELLQRWVAAEGPERRRLARLRLKREPGNEYLLREVIEADMEDAATQIANSVFGGQNVLAVEAAQYSPEAGGKFPLVVHVRDKRSASQDSLRAFYGAIKGSGSFAGVTNVFVTFGASTPYDVYGNTGLPGPSGVMEFMLSMRGIERTDWQRLSNKDMDRLFAAEGHSGWY